MTEILKNIILINGYWLSLALIGFLILLFISRATWVRKPIKNIARFAVKQHAFVVLLVSFTTTAFIAAVLSIFLYILKSPVEVAIFGYLAALTISVVYLIYLLIKYIFSVKSYDIFKLSKQSLLVKCSFLILCLMLAGDYAISIYFGSHAALGSDTYFHLTRMLNIVSNGFNIDSGFFEGIREGAYHYNVIYVLYTIPAKLFSYAPSLIWEYSYGFFRLLQWLAIFTLAFHAVKKWIQQEDNFVLLFAIAATIAGIVCFSPTYFIATYPNQIAHVWLVLLVIGISYYGFKPSTQTAIPVVALAFLATMTHPTYALVAAVFLCFVFAVRFVVDKNRLVKIRDEVIFYTVTVLTLMTGPIITYLTPSQLNSSQLHINDPTFISIMGMSIRSPKDIIPTTMIGFIIFSLTALMNLYFIHKLWKNKRQWSLVFSFMSFFAFLVYCPIVFSILIKILPYWVIERFSSMDMIEYLFVPVGIYVALLLLFGILKKIKIKTNKNLFSLLFIVLVLGFSLSQFVSSYKKLQTYEKDNSSAYEMINRNRNDFKDVFTKNKTVLTNVWASYFLPAVFPVHVVAVETGHSTISADATDRLACQKYMLKNFIYEDLIASGVDFIALSKYDESYVNQRSVADSKPYLKFVAQNQEFYVYEIITNNDNNVLNSNYKPCNDYGQKENR